MEQLWLTNRGYSSPSRRNVKPSTFGCCSIHWALPQVWPRCVVKQRRPRLTGRGRGKLASFNIAIRENEQDHMNTVDDLRNRYAQLYAELVE